MLKVSTGCMTSVLPKEASAAAPYTIGAGCASSFCSSFSRSRSWVRVRARARARVRVSVQLLQQLLSLAQLPCESDGR